VVVDCCWWWCCVFFFVLVEILLVRLIDFSFCPFCPLFFVFLVCEQDDRDWRVSGGNPCLEQSLESFEMCCLVETFPARHESKEDYLDTLKYAFLYAKTVTLGSTHWSKTNQVMLRNRRIGCSMSGVAQFTAQHGLPGLLEWCEEGYDQVRMGGGVVVGIGCSAVVVVVCGGGGSGGSGGGVNVVSGDVACWWRCLLVALLVGGGG
jgi:hypothetical protein